jgi:geranylgeranyl diphosphate synthase type II
MQIGGKRVRPVLVLIGNDIYEGDAQKALYTANAIEIFHNFTLMHDDIMDHAPLRRGFETVHTKWGVVQGILSGDIMLVKAYEMLNHLPDHIKTKAIEVFSKVAIGVCEGQQLDMDFEKLSTVTIEQYIEMITLKTAVLLGGALQLGAITAGADDYDSRKLFEIGKYLGISFQLFDDYLDVFGEQEQVGKQKGGDIIANKKTYMLLKALELSDAEQRNQLNHWLTAKEFEPLEKVKAISDIYIQTGVNDLVKNEMQQYFHKAMVLLDELGGNKEAKLQLRNLSEYLMKRQN